MIDSDILKIDKVLSLDVSRETLSELELYKNAIISKNKNINLISKSTEKLINTRHIEDSAQTIDFIDKKDIKTCTDLGSGAGLPGIVLGILMKSKKPLFKLIFYEKSYHKSIFLEEMTKKFNLNSEVHRKNIFDERNLAYRAVISFIMIVNPRTTTIHKSDLINMSKLVPQNIKLLLYSEEYEENVNIKNTKNKYLSFIANLLFPFF